MKPASARLAASTPLSAARPRCSRFTIAPVPERANSSSPQDSEPAMPSALVIFAASNFNSRPTATAPPNGPVVPGAWKPRFSLLCLVARPMRIITSAPAITAAISSRPPMPRSCATASAGMNMVAPGCTPVLGQVRLSISKACASAPLASAAIGACRPRATRREDMGFAASAAPLGVIDDDPAPGQGGSESDGGDGVGDGVLGALDYRRRQVPNAERSRVVRQLQCFLSHPNSLYATRGNRVRQKHRMAL